MRRAEAREKLMQLIFQMDAQNDFSVDMKNKYMEIYVPSSKQDDYFNMLFDLITEHLKEIDSRLESVIDNWTINRIAKVDLAVLRLAAAEMYYCEAVPESVAINEAVDLSKKFSGEDSGKFVNGVLGKLSKENKKLSEKFETEE